MIDNFITENDKMLLYEYFDYIDSMDIDGIVDALSDKVYEAMLVSAEGVHY